jgi:hypothetical protein
VTSCDNFDGPGDANRTLLLAGHGVERLRALFLAELAPLTAALAAFSCKAAVFFASIAAFLLTFNASLASLSASFWALAKAFRSTFSASAVSQQLTTISIKRRDFFDDLDLRGKGGTCLAGHLGQGRVLMPSTPRKEGLDGVNEGNRRETAE